jgi:NitT/TauT family transport system ATP-binding protein
MEGLLECRAAKISIDGVGRSFTSSNGEIHALRDAALDIADGEFCCLLGPSGCGKTTLLRIIAGLTRPTSGRITIRHSDASRPARAMVFQDYSVFPWMTVRRNVELPLKIRNVAPSVIETRVSDWLRRLGLTPFSDSYPTQLSGGMRQRVALARAFVTGAEVLLMDEPLAALDAQLRQLLQEDLLRLWEETRTTVVFVTHSIEEALLLGDRVVLMGARPGRVSEIIDVPFKRPRDPQALRQSPAFAELRERIWGRLREEVQSQLVSQ